MSAHHIKMQDARWATDGFCFAREGCELPAAYTPESYPGCVQLPPVAWLTSDQWAQRPAGQVAFKELLAIHRKQRPSASVRAHVRFAPLLSRASFCDLIQWDRYGPVIRAWDERQIYLVCVTLNPKSALLPEWQANYPHLSEMRRTS